MVSPSASRRRHRLIDKKLQLPVIRAIVLQATFLCALFLGSALWLDSRVRAVIREFMGPEQLIWIGPELGSARQFLLLRLAIAFALTVAVMALFGLEASQRLAGPVLRLKRVFGELARGDASQRLTFRARDHQTELASALNDRLSWADQGLARVKAEMPYLETWLRSLREGIAQTHGAPAPEEVHAIQQSLRRIRDPWPGSPASQGAREDASRHDGRRTFPFLRRRRRWVHGRLQLRFIGGLLVRLGLCLALISWLIGHHLSTVRGVLAGLPAELALAPAEEALALLATRFQLGIAVLGLLSMLLAAWWSLVISHTLAGPLHRLSSSLGSPPAELGPIRFRQNDHLSELAAVLSTAQEAQARRQETIVSTVGALSDRARALEAGSAGTSPAELCHQMQGLLEVLTATLRPPVDGDPAPEARLQEFDSQRHHDEEP